ncbi:hypothetical protein CIB84_014779, partial [Bambusicola thoracicus]
MAPSLPPPPASTADTEQDPRDSPQGHLALPAAHHCSHLLSPLQCACCVAGQVVTRTSLGALLATVPLLPMSSACFLPISLSKKDHHSRNLWALIMLTSHARSRRQTRSNAVF